jgi:uncharacterized protein (DUF1499 family)
MPQPESISPAVRERIGTALRRALTRTAATLAAAAGCAMLAGALLAYTGIVRPFTGFKLFGAALPASLGAVLIGIVGFALARSDDARSDRARARQALIAGVAMIAVFVLASLPGRGRPRINDITTDPSDPPSFLAATRDPANAGRDMSYPPDFAARQQKGYPSLAPISVVGAPAEVLPRALATAETLGWTIVASDPAAGTFEARQTSAIFHFVDDVSVRVRPDPADASKSRIDVRSKSRDGKGDLGVNAKRIDAFAKAISGG